VQLCCMYVVLLLFVASFLNSWPEFNQYAAVQCKIYDGDVTSKTSVDSRLYWINDDSLSIKIQRKDTEMHNE